MENTKIADIIESFRRQAYMDIMESMDYCFTKLAAYMVQTDNPERPGPTISKMLSGLPPVLFRGLYEDRMNYHDDDGIPYEYEGISFNSLATHVEAAGGMTIAELMMDFLDVQGLRRIVLKDRCPKAYKLWTDEEDASLRQLYDESAKSGDVIPWPSIASCMGRNVNAVKLRLEYLGYDLGPDAGHSRRSSGNLPG